MSKIVSLRSKEHQIEMKIWMQSFSEHLSPASYSSALKKLWMRSETWHPTFSIFYLPCRKQGKKFPITSEWKFNPAPGDQSCSYYHVNKSPDKHLWVQSNNLGISYANLFLSETPLVKHFTSLPFNLPISRIKLILLARLIGSVKNNCKLLLKVPKLSKLFLLLILLINLRK